MLIMDPFGAIAVSIAALSFHEEFADLPLYLDLSRPAVLKSSPVNVLFFFL